MSPEALPPRRAALALGPAVGWLVGVAVSVAPRLVCLLYPSEASDDRKPSPTCLIQDLTVTSIHLTPTATNPHTINSSDSHN